MDDRISRLDPRTPVIVGVGQAVERIDDPAYQGLSAADLAAAAARAAIADSGLGSAASAMIGAVGAVRTFEDSNAAPSPFGKPDKFPLAVARRLGLTPARALLDCVGGQSPVTVLMHLGEAIRRGETAAALVFGAEAMSSARHLVASGATRDWAETDSGDIEDMGMGVKGLLSPLAIAHGVVSPPVAYALMDNARRGRLGQSVPAYARAMGELFAPFTQVAAANPYSCAAVAPLTAEAIATPSDRNRLVSDPYPVKLVARDQVNQGAAVLLCSLGAALAAGLAPAALTFVHAATLTREKELLARPDLGAYPAAVAAIASALDRAGLSIAGCDAFDFYSCFPIPVFATAIDAFGLRADDPRGLTVTGGLPYFGGAGNNYSMHAIAAMVERLRPAGGTGLIGANGGFQSKYAALVLSGQPAPWPGAIDTSAQAQCDTVADVVPQALANGEGLVETYTVWRDKGVPRRAIAIGRLPDGARFVASAADAAALDHAASHDLIGSTVNLAHDGQLTRFSAAG